MARTNVEALLATAHRGATAPIKLEMEPNKNPAYPRKIDVEATRRAADTIDLKRDPSPAQQDKEAELEAGRGLVLHGDVLDAETSVPNIPKRQLPVALRNLDLLSIESRVDLMEQLNTRLPLNDMELPDFLYRPDLLDYTAFTRLGTQGDLRSDSDVLGAMDLLKAAEVRLYYNEGFPTLKGGTPLWFQLPYETAKAYAAFERYISLSGVRRLIDLAPIRPEESTEWFHLYVWDLRVKAFDLFVVAHHRKNQLSRRLQTEDNHYKMAKSALEAVTAQFAAINWEEAKVTPPQLVKMMADLAKIQRDAIGLVAGGDLKQPLAPVQTTHVIMQQIAPKAAQSAREEDEIDLLRDDPESIELAQELILRLEAGKMAK